MLTAVQRETIRRARDEQARDRAKRTRRIEDQLERDFAHVASEITGEPLVPNHAISREEVIDALQRWERDHGRRPKAADFQAAKNGYDRPSYDVVIRVFGSWPVAISAAFDEQPAQPEPEPIPEPPPAPPELEPLPTPPVLLDPVGENPSLADLAGELEAANEAVEQAETRYEAALERFRAHPLMVVLAE